MSGIFISYRRSGASVMAYRIADELKRSFGSESLFLDVESIDPGMPFAQAIQHSLNRCSVALIVMGPEWLNMTDDQGRRRLDNPDDWVRQEVRLALESKLRVIPVLVKGAFMPNADDLPSDIQRLASLHAFSFIDSQTHWSFDCQRLQDQISDIDKRLAKKRKNTPVNNGADSASYSYKAIAGLVISLFLLLGFGIQGYVDQDEAIGGLMFLIGALLLCFFGWKDIRAGLKKGVGFAIGGGVLSILTMLMTVGQLSDLSTNNTTATLTINHVKEDAPVPQIEPVSPSANTTLTIAEPEPIRPQAVNIGGNWISEEGASYFIRQNGETFSFTENNIFGMQVGRGEGRIQGNQIAYSYYNSVINVSGQGRGTVNNNVMSLYYTDQYNNALYYEVYRQ